MSEGRVSLKCAREITVFVVVFPIWDLPHLKVRTSDV